MMENLAWGLTVTAMGMGLVFALLAMLWGLISVVVRIDREPQAAAGPASAASPEEPPSASGASVRQELPGDLMAAIIVATLKHKANRRREAAPVMRTFRPGSQLHSSRWVSSGRVLQNRSWRREGK